MTDQGENQPEAAEFGCWLGGNECRKQKRRNFRPKNWWAGKNKSDGKKNVAALKTKPEKKMSDEVESALGRSVRLDVWTSYLPGASALSKTRRQHVNVSYCEEEKRWLGGTLAWEAPAACVTWSRCVWGGLSFWLGGGLHSRTRRVPSQRDKAHHCLPLQSNSK